MNEAEIARGGLVISGCDAPCVLQTVDASLDEVTQDIDEIVDGFLNPSAFSHRNDCGAAALFDVSSDAIRIIAPVGQQHLRVRPAIHHPVVALVVRDLPGGDLGLREQAAAIGAEMNLAREATF